jgi:hypothetical protein
VSSPDVLDRLHRLEEAVFGPAQGAVVENIVPGQHPKSKPETLVPLPSRTQRERSAELDYNHGTEAPVSSSCHILPITAISILHRLLLLLFLSLKVGLGA